MRGHAMSYIEIALTLKMKCRMPSFKALAHLDQYKGEAEFSSWLYRIVKDECLMLLQIRQRAKFTYLGANTAPARTRGNGGA